MKSYPRLIVFSWNSIIRIGNIIDYASLPYEAHDPLGYGSNPVPVPASLYLLISGLLALAGIGRKTG
ncbi:MAG: VPLPA-CTERM sorting domain-containing protein [Deltaproteobacteria bacterium]|nr:VPLPA-CTERM sorting domain-containing protein [Deltaproteobacteria bacterium]